MYPLPKKVPLINRSNNDQDDDNDADNNYADQASTDSLDRAEDFHPVQINLGEVQSSSK